MPQNMNPLVLFARERFFADLTNVRLLAGVQPDVCGQRVVLLERHVADVAHEGVVLQMAIRVVLLLHLNYHKTFNFLQR